MRRCWIVLIDYGRMQNSAAKLRICTARMQNYATEVQNPIAKLQNSTARTQNVLIDYVRMQNATTGDFVQLAKNLTDNSA